MYFFYLESNQIHQEERIIDRSGRKLMLYSSHTLKTNNLEAFQDDVTGKGRTQSCFFGGKAVFEIMSPNLHFALLA